MCGRRSLDTRMDWLEARARAALTRQRVAATTTTVTPVLDQIAPAVAAVEAELGGPQQYFEINATPQLVNLFVAIDGATRVAPYVYVGGELAPAADPAGAEGPTFGSDVAAFDPGAVLDGVAAELPDADVELVLHRRRPGAVPRQRPVRRRWRPRGRPRRRRHDPVRRPGRLTCRGASTPPWYREIRHDHLGSIEAPDGQEPRAVAGHAGQARRPPAMTTAPAPRRRTVEHEFIGIGLIIAGALIGLAIYFDLAGPLGRAVETLLGWFVGLGRFAIPVGLVAAGVALVSKGQSSSPVRLAIGWGMIAMAVVGIAHVVNGPDGFTDLDDMNDVRRVHRCARRRTAAGPARPGRRRHPAARPRHRRGAADHPHVGADDGHAHERAVSGRSPGRSDAPPARRCASCRR